jgi:hypothetical protein
MRHTVVLPPAPVDPTVFRDSFASGIDPRTLPHHPELSITFDSPLLDGCEVRQLEAVGLKLLMDCRDDGLPAPTAIHYSDARAENGHPAVTICTDIAPGIPWALQVLKP